VSVGHKRVAAFSAPAAAVTAAAARRCFAQEQELRNCGQPPHALPGACVRVEERRGGCRCARRPDCERDLSHLDHLERAGAHKRSEACGAARPDERQ